MSNNIPEGSGWYLDEYDAPKFWSHVRFDGGKPYLTDPLSPLESSAGECWLWTGWSGGKPPFQYGRFKIFGTHVQATRIGMQEFGGKIRDDEVTDHLCRHTPCVRHNHLEAVTQLENVRRGSRAQATHCKYGHEYTDENTRVVQRGDRVFRLCRICRKEYAARAYRKSLSV